MPAQPHPTPDHPHTPLLNELLTIGMDLARTLNARAADPDLTPEQLAALAGAFERVARTVRRTILLIGLLARAEQPPIAPRAASAGSATHRTQPPSTAGPGRDRPDSLDSIADLAAMSPQDAAETLERELSQAASVAAEAAAATTPQHHHPDKDPHPHDWSPGEIRPDWPRPPGPPSDQPPAIAHAPPSHAPPGHAPPAWAPPSPVIP